MKSKPSIYTDTLRMVQDRMEQLQPRGGGEDPLADRYPLGRDVVESIEWQGRGTSPDLIGKLRKDLKHGLQAGNPP